RGAAPLRLRRARYAPASPRVRLVAAGQRRRRRACRGCGQPDTAKAPRRSAQHARPVKGARHRIQPRREAALRLLRRVLQGLLSRTGCNGSLDRDQGSEPMVGKIRDMRDQSRRVLILGSGPLATTLIEEIESAENRRYIVAGTVDDQMPEPDSLDYRRWIGPLDSLADIVDRVHPAFIVVALADRRDRLPLQMLLEARVRGIVVEDALDFSERLMGKMAIGAIRPSTLILAKGFRNHGAADLLARAVSIIGAIVGLLLCAPLLVAIGLAVKIDSRGPMFFTQQRAGRTGRPFGLIKFRTMHPCDEPR